MTDLARWKLRGPVRTLREEHADWDAAARAWGPPGRLQVVALLPDGRFSESELHNPDGSVVRMAYQYDRDGRIVETQSWMEAHSKRRHVFFHEAGGRLTDVVDIGPDGTRRIAETVRYDSTGRRTLSEDRTEYKYDDRGNWTERVVRTRDGADAGLRPSNVTRRSITYYDA